jgi:ferredoxin/flavodoxin---NADP+ reductase
VVSDGILRYIDYPACGRIDTEEVLRGRKTGKPRENFVAFDDMFAAADGGVAC